MEKLSIEETGEKKEHVSVLGTRDLRRSRLLTSVLEIPDSVYRTVCIKLNSKDEIFLKDYRMLCEDLGYNNTVARGLEQPTTANPTYELLWMWSLRDADEATVGNLINLLREEDLKRTDVVNILKDWVEGDPHSRLSTRANDIPRSVKSQICLKLNIEDMLWKDYRMLAEKLKFNRDEIEGLKQGKADPTNALIQMWCKENGPLTVSKLIELLKEKREDVVTVLWDWVDGIRACK